MLFEPFVARSLQLANRAVMAPMTRSRAAENNTPNALMDEYYGQRASAGLIVTEGTSPSPNGLGYPRIPGLLNEAQMRGWRLVTDVVHAKGGKTSAPSARCADPHRPGTRPKAWPPWPPTGLWAGRSACKVLRSSAVAPSSS